MAIDAVRKFLDLAGQDQNLQEDLGRALVSAADRFAALAHVASEHGYDASADEVRAVVEGEPASELSDKELARVTGGANNFTGPLFRPEPVGGLPPGATGPLVRPRPQYLIDRR